jgi:hypothetical protein
MSGRVSRRVLLAGCAAVLPGVSCASDLLFLNRQSCDRCEIPALVKADQKFSQPVSGTGKASISTSTPPLTVPTSSKLGDTRQIRTFAITPRELLSDHCQVSRVAITVDDQGHWHAGLHAVQTPDLVAPELRPQLERVDRNLFRVEFRPIVVKDAEAAVVDKLNDELQLELIATQDFWVNRRETRHVSLSGQSEQLKAAFAQLDHVTVEFYWR